MYLLVIAEFGNFNTLVLSAGSHNGGSVVLMLTVTRDLAL